MNLDQRPAWRRVARILVLGMAGKMVLVGAAYQLATLMLDTAPL